MAFMDPLHGGNGTGGGPALAERLRRIARVAIPLGIVAVLALLVWTFARQETGVKRETAPISTLIPVQLPPPPPPPKTPPPPEPKPVPEEITPPTPAPPTPQPPTPTPSPAAPSPTAAAPGPQAVTENAPAQAGSDAFNIGAGSGNGGSGSGTGGGGGGGGAGLYGGYLTSALRRALLDDTLLHDKSLDVVADLWVGASGRIERMTLVRGSGVRAYDAEIRQVLLAQALRAPPANLQMPARVAIDFRRPL